MEEEGEEEEGQRINHSTNLKDGHATDVGCQDLGGDVEWCGKRLLIEADVGSLHPTPPSKQCLCFLCANDNLSFVSCRERDLDLEVVPALLQLQDCFGHHKDLLSQERHHSWRPNAGNKQSIHSHLHRTLMCMNWSITQWPCCFENSNSKIPADCKQLIL